MTPVWLTAVLWTDASDSNADKIDEDIESRAKAFLEYLSCRIHNREALDLGVKLLCMAIAHAARDKAYSIAQKLDAPEGGLLCTDEIWRCRKCGVVTTQAVTHCNVKMRHIGFTYLSVQSLADHLRMLRGNVSRALGELEKEGLILRAGTTQERKIWVILPGHVRL